jgi:hypothetical protein
MAALLIGLLLIECDVPIVDQLGPFGGVGGERVAHFKRRSADGRGQYGRCNAHIRVLPRSRFQPGCLIARRCSFNTAGISAGAIRPNPQ